MAPSWFELLAWVALGLGFASALVIVADIVVLGNWQHMAIMNLAFPLTALYMGPIALWAYFARGRRMSRKRMHTHMAGMREGPATRCGRCRSRTATAAPAACSGTSPASGSSGRPPG